MDLILFAHAIGTAATQHIGNKEQKVFGQFMTPPGIARVMASRLATGIETETVRILEPAAGSGILAAAMLEALLAKENKPKKIEFRLCEIDVRLQPGLKQVAEKMRNAGRKLGVQVSVSITIGDFLLSKFATEKPQFDIVISNPPYFKLKKADTRSIRHAYAVYGQPNIYGLFMAACARVLEPQGRWCFITPRSWTNGPYFTAVRRQVLRFLHIDSMHIFESRHDHFTDDDILQEAMITWATAQVGAPSSIIVSTSQGLMDLPDATLHSLPSSEIIDTANESVISLPTYGAFEYFRQFTATLATYNLKVSTGPVVAFRAAKYIVKNSGKHTVPLLWMQHINRMRVNWPVQKKTEHIIANAATAWMLVPNENMIIMRRFSPKEDQRRITAAPYLAGSLPGKVIGLENHTNYIYRPGGFLNTEETRGICAYLNSCVVDQYLRAVSGNTQINASDLRVLPLPPLATLIEIGHALANESTLEQTDLIVEAVLKIQYQSVAA